MAKAKSKGTRTTGRKPNQGPDGKFARKDTGDGTVPPNPAGQNGGGAATATMDPPQPEPPAPDPEADLKIENPYANFEEKQREIAEKTAPPRTPISQRRARRNRRRSQPTALQQIRTYGREGLASTGTWSYWLRPDGATIREVLVIYPNGGVPEIDDERMRERHGRNADYYRARMQRKGFEYVGPTLTPQGIRRLIEILEANKQDEIEFLQEELEQAQWDRQNRESPELKQQAQRRITQLEQRIEMIRQPVDGEKLVAELEDIRQAQNLAQLPPAVRRAMAALTDQMSENVKALAAQLARGRGSAQTTWSDGSELSTSKGLTTRGYELAQDDLAQE